MPIAISVALLSVLPPVENSFESLPFVLATALLVAVVFFVFTRRLTFSVCCGWMVVGILSIISVIKFKNKGFSLHFYDMVFLDGDAVTFLFDSYPHLVLPVLLLMALLSYSAFIMYRLDRPRRLNGPKRILVLLAATVLLPLTFPADAYERQRHFYYLAGRHVTAFFVSLLDLEYMFVENELERRLSKLPPQAPFSGAAKCGDGDLPDIMVVLEETQTSPEYFPQLESRDDMAAAMVADGETLNPLNVEVFGGGTWITGLSFLTGLSAMDFGWRNPYLTMTLQDSVKGALPQILADCGYHTMAILSLDYHFVNEGPFLSSIGFETVLDRLDIEAPKRHMRDNFYFETALKEIRKHRLEDDRPLFLYVQTMFAHSPYDKRKEPDIILPGEPFHPNKKIAEYWRRVLIGRRDYADFAQQVRADATERGIVLMSFGDHQGSATMPLIEELEEANPLTRPGSVAYRTYYTLTSSAGTSPPKPAPENEASIDIGYLGTDLLQAAGIPGSDVFEDLATLKQACKGAYYECEDREAVDRHLRRRIDGGLLDLLPNEQPAAAGS